MRDFRLYLVARVLITLGLQIQLLVVGWHVYRITRSPLALGYVGLVQFLPSVGLVLVTGHVADRFDRSRILALCHGVMAVCAVLLAAIAASGAPDVRLLYTVLFVVGVARAFAGPAGQSLLPLLVPEAELARSIAKVSSAWQMATILGPSIGGLLYGSAPSTGATYLLSAALMATACGLVACIRTRGEPVASRGVSWSTVTAGLRYIFENRVLLGAISLDLLAVLLGGAVALLPVFAADVLRADASALGRDQSAKPGCLISSGMPGLGAAVSRPSPS